MIRLLPKIQMQILANHRFGRGDLCAEDLERIRNWSFRLKNEQKSLLTQSGEEEMEGLGRRWGTRLPGLQGKTITWGFTDTQRTMESARKFKEGMGDTSDLPPPIKNKKVLAFYNICQAYKKAIFQVDGKKVALFLFRIDGLRTQLKSYSQAMRLS